MRFDLLPSWEWWVAAAILEWSVVAAALLYRRARTRRPSLAERLAPYSMHAGADPWTWQDAAYRYRHAARKLREERAA